MGVRDREPLGIIPGGFGDGIKKYGLSGVGSSLARTGSHGTRIGQVPAGLLLLGYALVLVIAGTLGFASATSAHNRPPVGVGDQF